MTFNKLISSITSSIKKIATPKVIQGKLQLEGASFNCISIPIDCIKLYLFCVTQDYQFTTFISIPNTGVLKIIPSSLISYNNKCNNKRTPHVAFALYTKYIRLTRFGWGFMISCKLVIMVWSNSSLPVDSIDAASLEVKNNIKYTGRLEPSPKMWKFSSL